MAVGRRKVHLHVADNDPWIDIAIAPNAFPSELLRTTACPGLVRRTRAAGPVTSSAAGGAYFAACVRRSLTTT